MDLDRFLAPTKEKIILESLGSDSNMDRVAGDPNISIAKKLRIFLEEIAHLHSRRGNDLQVIKAPFHGLARVCDLYLPLGINCGVQTFLQSPYLIN